MPSDSARSDASRLGLAWRDGVAVAAFCVLIAGLAAWQVARERQRVFDTLRAGLEATAASQERQLELWLTERKADGRVVASFPSVVDELRGIPHAYAEAGAGADEQPGAQLLDVLKVVQDPYGYSGVYLFDRAGREVAGVGEPSAVIGAIAEVARSAMASSVQEVREVRGAEGSGRFAFGTPVIDPVGGGGAAIGAVVALVDARSTLWAMIADEQDALRSAETVVVRRQGADAVLLSAQRDGGGDAAAQVPLAQASPAIGAALAGEERFGEFVDQRGRRVLAATRYVDSSAWGLVRAIDYDEALAPLQRQVWQISLSAALAALAVGGFALAGVRRRRAHGLAQQLAHARELSDVRARYRALSEYANDIVLFLAPDGRILEGNRSAEIAYGYPRDELLGRRVQELCPPAAQASIEEPLRVALTTPLVFETNNQHRDGTAFAVEVSAVSTDVGGERVLVCIIRDISERALALAQLRASEQRYRQLSADLERRVEARTAALEVANADLASFNYSVSHDLRAPLRHIAGFIRILEEEFGAQLPAVGRGYLERVANGSRRMSELIEALLALSRAGRAEMRPAAIDLKALVLASFEEARPPDRAIEFALGDLPVVSGDPALIRQLFDNLLGNALKFSAHQAAPRIEVGVRRGAGADELYVRDNGVGFDAAHADRLFRVFSRLHREADFEGTGIGLSIVKRIVERHGGRVWAESVAGQGATFFFTLGPLALPDEEST